MQNVMLKHRKQILLGVIQFQKRPDYICWESYRAQTSTEMLDGEVSRPLSKHQKCVLMFPCISSWRDCGWPAADEGLTLGLNVTRWGRLSRVNTKAICWAAEPQRCRTTRLWCRSSDPRGARFYRFPSNRSTSSSWPFFFAVTHIWKCSSRSSCPSGKGFLKYVSLKGYD